MGPILYDLGMVHMYHSSPLPLLNDDFCMRKKMKKKRKKERGRGGPGSFKMTLGFFPGSFWTLTKIRRQIRKKVGVHISLCLLVPCVYYRSRYVKT